MKTRSHTHSKFLGHILRRFWCQLKKLGREAKTNGWASLAPWFDATGTFIPGDGFVEWLFARYPSQTANIIQALDPAAFAHERAAKQQASKGSAAKPQ